MSKSTMEPTTSSRKPSKAYNNKEFIHSKDGRTVRILSEYLYPEQYFRKYGISRAIIFYGSARILSLEQYQLKLEKLTDNLAKADDSDKYAAQAELDVLIKQREMTQCYEDAMKLAEMLAKWSQKLSKKDMFYICTGGGPGMMEAANRGAALADSPTIGLNISLPFEQEPNAYVSADLSFEFHYFFMRKFWFVYLSKAFVALPGGFGTLDELSEILTLIQTTKVTREIPIVLYHEKFWRNLINFDYLVETGVVSQKDLKLFRYANSPEEAFEYITSELTRIHNL